MRPQKKHYALNATIKHPSGHIELDQSPLTSSPAAASPEIARRLKRPTSHGPVALVERVPGDGGNWTTCILEFIDEPTD